eukprot:jgi/Tetstr1/448265/TSEL_035552.t1
MCPVSRTGCLPKVCDARGSSPSPYLDRVFEYLLGNPRLHPAADEYYHAACHGAFIVGSAAELRKLLAPACATDGKAGLRIAARGVVHIVEAIDDGNRFRLACLRKRWDTQTRNGDTFALDVVRARYLRFGTENMGSPRCWRSTRIASTTQASQAPRRRQPVRASAVPSGATTATGTAAAITATTTTRVLSARLRRYEPLPSPSKDVTKDFGKGKVKAEPSAADKAE